MAYDSLNRCVRFSISYNTVNASGKTETVYLDKGISSVKVQQSASSGNVLKMGEFCKNSIEFTYFASEFSEVINWSNKKINVFVTESNSNITKLGVFYVSAKDVTTSDNGKTYTVTGYDMPEIMSEEFDTTQSGTSVAKILEYITKISGLYFKKDTVFSLKEISSVPNGTTNTGIIGYLAGYDGKNARINANGEIETYWFEKDASKVTFTIGRNIQYLNYLKNKSDLPSLNALLSGNGVEGIEGVTYTSGSGNSLSFVNPYMTQAQLDLILANVKGFTYSCADVKWRGDPSVRAGDTVKLETSKGKYVLFPIQENSISFDGGMSFQSTSYSYESQQTVMGKTPTEKKLQALYEGLSKEFQHITGIVNNKLKGGFYRLLQDEGTKFPYGWQIADSEEITPTTKGWRWTQGGLMHSSDGFRTADRFAFTEDGHLAAEMIAAKSITIGALDTDLSNTINSSLSNATVEWYVSSSPTELSGGSWSEERPVWTEQNYIWQRLKSINKKGEVSYSQPSCVQGNTGAKGEQGIQGVQGIQGESGDEIYTLRTQWYLSESSSELVGGEWLIEEPAYIKDHHYWSRTHVIWDTKDASRVGVIKVGEKITYKESYTQPVLSDALSKAYKDAMIANENATNASTSASKALASALAAEHKANDASSKADGAVSSANNANNLANQAVTDSKDAQDKAKEIQKASDEATAKAKEAIEGFNRFDQVIKMDNTGLKIKASADENANTMQLTNDGMQISAAEKVVAEYTAIQSRVNNLVAENYLYTGAHRFEKTTMNTQVGTGVFFVG